MSDVLANPHFETALARRAAPTGLSFALREMADRGMIDLRGMTTDRKFMAAVKSVLGADLPKVPRASVAWGDVKMLWLSPDQWLVLCPRARAPALAADLGKALSGIHSQVTNVSDMRTVLRLEGENLRVTLAKGTSTDLMAAEVKPGFVKRLKFAEVGALINIVEDEIFELYVFRSQADYVWDFLLATGTTASALKIFGPQTPA
jgi:sarcosine oxidase subunit gamma